ncbi:hypothetical protein Tco_1454849 [Tanacetum coccineum]
MWGRPHLWRTFETVESLKTYHTRHVEPTSTHKELSSGCRCGKIRDYFSCVVDEVLVAGATCSTEVDQGVPVRSTGLRAASTGTGETIHGGGLKYSSNIGGNIKSQSFLAGEHKVLIEEDSS